MNVTGYNNKLRMKCVSFLTIFSLISLVLVTALPVSACHYTIGTYEDDYTISKNEFLKGETVYGRGNAFGYNYLLKFRIKNPDGDIVYYSNESKYVVNGEFFINETAKPGNWYIQLGIYKKGWQWPTGTGRISSFTLKALNYTLSINIEGNGSISKTPDQPSYIFGTEVELTATADPGWTFCNWSGNLTGSSNLNTIIMDNDKSVTAHFVKDRYTFSLNIIKEGSGLVEVDFEGPYYYGDIVNLTAIPDVGNSFVNWSGDLNSSNNPESIVMDSDKTIVAHFTKNKYNLTINLDGNGYVLKDPSQKNYTYGTIVNLTAVANSGWVFDHWSGNINGANITEQVIIVDDITITAHFKKSENNGGNNNGGGSNGNNKGTSLIPSGRNNKAPIAIAGGPYFGFLEELIEFNASKSYDRNYDIKSYIWNFGDGTTGEGKIVKHNFSAVSNYSVSLKVVDSHGASDINKTIAIIYQPNHPPSDPNISGPSLGVRDNEYEFSIVSSDKDNDKIRYIIDWGDDTQTVSDFIPSNKSIYINHTWSNSGIFSINAVADDNEIVSNNNSSIIIDEPKKLYIPEESNLCLLVLLVILILIVLSLFLTEKERRKKKKMVKKTNKVIKEKN